MIIHGEDGAGIPVAILVPPHQLLLGIDLVKDVALPAHVPLGVVGMQEPAHGDEHGET